MKVRDHKMNQVEVQIEIARKYVEEFNLKNTEEIIDIIDYYTDLGKTGSNFEREGFLRLLQDIRLGEINCVIVKDLSRFGRNYLEAGNYIEKIFPFLEVRFIAVADGFDTGKEGNENKQMASEIKNLVNDMYAKDFSKKAKLHLKQRERRRLLCWRSSTLWIYGNMTTVASTFAPSTTGVPNFVFSPSTMART